MKEVLLITLIIDNSAAAVQGEKFKKIKESLKRYEQKMKENGVKNIELQIVSFNDFDPIIVKKFGENKIDFDSWGEYKMPFLGKAIDLGLNEMFNRIDFYKIAEVNLYKPWMFILTDAYSFDDLEEVSKQIKLKLAENKMLYMPFVLSKKKIPENIEPLLATKRFMRIKENTYDLFFDWFLDMSVKRASKPIGESVKFDRSGFEGWAVL